MLFKEIFCKFLSSFLLIFAALVSCCHAEEDHQKDSGTIIVNYRTIPNAENLDRIRFLLINSNDQRKMYPQGKSYVDDPSNGSRVVLIENAPEGDYRIEFLLPNTKDAYEPVTHKEFHITAGGVVKINQTIRKTASVALNDDPLTFSQKPTSETVDVPAGKAIIGDPFNDDKDNELSARTVDITAFKIGIYEVTNAQFARWLNDAFIEEQIVVNSDGTVSDKEGKILFRTLTAEPKSTISFSLGEKGNHFNPLPGRQRHPVVHVTWNGARRFCQDNGCRLPTEAEWEKAAGMAPQKGENHPLKKYKYGFGQDTIDHTWANYKENNDGIKKIKVNTREVGFYNGKNVLPLRENDHVQLKTHDAKSPVGAYDMSGNVWEWTNDWFTNDLFKNMSEKNPQGPRSGTHKVAKGGCYDSLSEGVRVAERLAAPPDYSDEFTGFRIAI